MWRDPTDREALAPIMGRLGEVAPLTTSSFQLEWSSFLIEFQVCDGSSQTMTFMERAVNQVLVDVDWHGRQCQEAGGDSRRAQCYCTSST